MILIDRIYLPEDIYRIGLDPNLGYPHSAFYFRKKFD